MSGPKVVRIVTRDELIALCDGHIARLEAAVTDWKSVGLRNGVVSETEIKAVESRLSRLRGLLNSEKFLELQKEVPQEISHLERDMNERLSTAARRAAEARSMARRMSEAASVLLTELGKAGVVVAVELTSALEAVASGKADEGAMRQGFELLANSKSGNTAARNQLADSLKTGEGVNKWVTAQGKSSLEKLDALLIDLGQVANQGLKESFEARFLRLQDEPVEARRNLLADSLEVDLASATREARETAAMVRELDLSIAELAKLCSVMADEIRTEAKDANSPTMYAQLRKRADAAILDARENIAATARRTAVLEGLSSLGYEVRDGLTTAWANNGSVVLRKADRPSYGVEISGDPSAPRWQVRAVAFTGGGAPPALDADKDAETLWCQDVQALKARLSSNGGDLVLERALPIGATPLRRVEDATFTTSVGDVKPVLKTRHLD